MREYYQKGGIEPLDVMKAKMNHDQLEGFLWGNVLKYAMRWQEKNGIDDLRKLHDYAGRLIEHQFKGVDSSETVADSGDIKGRTDQERDKQRKAFEEMQGGSQYNIPNRARAIQSFNGDPRKDSESARYEGNYDARADR